MQVHGVFIHDINPSSLVTGDGGYKEMYKQNGMHFFDTYVGAGFAAFQQSLISHDALRDLIENSRVDFDTIPFKDADMQQMRQDELDRDVQQATLALETFHK